MDGQSVIEPVFIEEQVSLNDEASAPVETTAIEEEAVTFSQRKWISRWRPR